MRAITTLAILIATSLAGCADAPAEETVDDGPVITDATGKKVRDEAPSDETVTTESGKQVAANKALLRGRVHDDFNFSLSGAFVSIVGTAQFTYTDKTGNYVLENVTVGTFDVRFEMDQFKARELRVVMEAGKEVRLDAELLPLQARSGGFNPHVHDPWDDATTRIIMDHSFSVNGPLDDGQGPIKSFGVGPVDAAQCVVNQCRFHFTLPDQSDGKPATVWPGTKEMRVTLDWSGPAMLVSKARFDYGTPDMSGFGRTEGPELGKGETATITVAPEMQDHGHASWTAWQFTIVTLNNPGAPGYLSGTFHVKIELVKGEIVLDPPHEDFWKERTQMPIGDWNRRYVPGTGVPPTRADTTDGHHAFPLAPCQKPREGETSDCVSIIPPGTSHLEVRFAWLPSAQGPAPFDHSMLYRTADQHPTQTPVADFKQPLLIDEDLEEDWRLYRIDVEGKETDSFYMQKSDWAFKWVQDTGLPYNVAQFQYGFNIQVTAFKSQ